MLPNPKSGLTVSKLLVLSIAIARVLRRIYGPRHTPFGRRTASSFKALEENDQAVGRSQILGFKNQTGD